MTQETNTLPEAHSVSDLDTFFQLLASWHQSKVAILNHMLTVPEGTQATLDGEDAPTITLTGEVLAAYKLGIELSLIELGTLPFYPETEDETTASDEPLPA